MPGIGIYLPGIIMHEFGHTAGLPDICDELDLKPKECEEAGYRGHLMAHNVKWFRDNYLEIPVEDRGILTQGYQDEDDSESD